MAHLLACGWLEHSKSRTDGLTMSRIASARTHSQLSMDSCCQFFFVLSRYYRSLRLSPDRPSPSLEGPHCLLQFCSSVLGIIALVLMLQVLALNSHHAPAMHICLCSSYPPVRPAPNHQTIPGGSTQRKTVSFSIVKAPWPTELRDEA